MKHLIPKPLIKLSGNKKSWTLAGAESEASANKDGVLHFENCGLIAEPQTKAYGKASSISYKIKNSSCNTVHIDHISSGFFDSIGGGLLPWWDERKFKLHYCFFTWQGEAQWREASLSDLGLYHASNHRDVNAIRLRSVGNQSTAIYYPQIFIEDKEQNQTYFFNIETTGNWYIEIGGNMDGTLSVELNSAFSNNDCWFLNLKQDEEYNTSVCVYGVTDGGFEESVAVMTDYRRMTSKAKLDTPPVCFNDYMNCLFGIPNTDKLIPLIDKAAEVGCEIFCIDSGWQIDPNDTADTLGDWEWCDSRFPDFGFKGIIDYIRGKGMLAGAWLELNSVAKTSNVYKKLSDCILKRNGNDAGSAGRSQLNFRKEAVLNYAESVIDNLYGIGIRYIKNDFNQTIGIGIDGELCGGEEAGRSSLAFISFIDKMRAKYSDLIIENCASGSMRTDDCIMKSFHLVSVSDQEYYYNNPSILTGTSACVQPEKCGSWAYPYPQLYDDRFKKASECVRHNADYDKNETVFNMINGMLGLMYLSGHIELADSENTALISEAISTYKTNRDFVAKAYPIYPSGRIRIERNGFCSYGLTDKSHSRIILGVWRINSAEDTEVFDLKKYCTSDTDIHILYPHDTDAEFSYKNGMLTVKLNSKYSAVMLEAITNK